LKNVTAFPDFHFDHTHLHHSDEAIVVEEGQRVLGWRDVPTNDADLGPSAIAVEPIFRQVFIGRGEAFGAAGTDADMRFERKLYVIRKRLEHDVDGMALPDPRSFYVPSLSSRTLIYKGMLTANQIAPMFPDLVDPDFESALALVHQRFSTNTFPSWPLAHPYRFIAHNGEINTLRGNINWMKARESLLESDVLGEDLKKILPIIREGGSDTAIFDNVLEFLVMAGRSLPHAVLMMIPEPWQNHEGMTEELRAFYEYHSSLMEPWDGPASIAFTDGTVIGAVLDRNGLRPSRYYVTKDDLVIMASEVGVLDIPPENIVVKERLHPGRIFLVDTEKGRIIADGRTKGMDASGARNRSRDESDALLYELKLAGGQSCSRSWKKTNSTRSSCFSQDRRREVFQLARAGPLDTGSPPRNRRRFGARHSVIRALRRERIAPMGIRSSLFGTRDHVGHLSDLERTARHVGSSRRGGGTGAGRRGANNGSAR